MDWAEYLQAKDALDLNSGRPALFMTGVMGDNGTKYLLDQKGLEFPNDEHIFNSVPSGRDFIWNGRCIRAHAGITTGGHPALAGFDTIYCAGKIKRDYFFFHSGHYKPELINALHFITDFIENSCARLHGVMRDNKVDALAETQLRLYTDSSGTKTYYTTFAAQAERVTTPQIHVPLRGVPIGTKSMPIGIKSSPISMKSSTTTELNFVSMSCKDTIDRGGFSITNEGTLKQELGIDPYAKHQLLFRVDGAPPWILDDAREKCAICEAAFHTFKRRHHCRQCGEIVCDDCSKHKKMLKHPSHPPNESAGKGPYRVCNTCWLKMDI